MIVALGSLACLLAVPSIPSSVANKQISDKYKQRTAAILKARLSWIDNQLAKDFTLVTSTGLHRDIGTFKDIQRIRTDLLPNPSYRVSYTIVGARISNSRIVASVRETYSGTLGPAGKKTLVRGFMEFEETWVNRFGSWKSIQIKEIRGGLTRNGKVVSRWPR